MKFIEVIKRWIKRTKTGSVLLDYKRYSEYKNLLFFESKEADKEAMNLLVRYHDLEKTKFRGGVLLKDKNELLEKIKKFISISSTPVCYEVIEGLSLLNSIALEENDKELKDELNRICAKYNLQLWNEVGTKDFVEYEAGNRERQFLLTRSSCRATTDEIIHKDLILKIIELASKAPSASNRQPCKVYYSTSRKGNLNIQSLVIDKPIAKNISNFMAVTVKRSLFSNGECLQYLINGGIFIESLLLSFHAYNLGAIIFQFPLRNNYKGNVRILNLPDDEVVIGIIGFGYPNYDYGLLQSKRRDHSEIARCIDECESE